MDRSRLERFVASPIGELPLGKVPIVSPDAPVSDALSVMRATGSSCVLSVRDGGLAGIFTERDVLTRCMEPGFDWSQPLETTVLTVAPRTIGADASVADAVALMQRHGYRTLPVVRSGELLGIVRLTDLLKHLAEAYPEDILNLPPRPNQVAEKREGG